MKSLINFIDEKRQHTLPKLSKEEIQRIQNELDELYSEYCCKRGQKEGESDNVGGTIVGALMYMLGRWKNDGDTCENNRRIERANDYLCSYINLCKYSYEFSDLSFVTNVNKSQYENSLWHNIKVALDYLKENENLFTEKETYFKLFNE